MPALICSSRYTGDSRILRKAAQQLGWETLRLDGNSVPSWFEPPDEEIAFYYTAPHAFDVARQLNRTLLGCNPDWTVNLPAEFLQRDLYQTSLVNALELGEDRFVKHSVSKVFPATVYTPQALAEATASVDPQSLVHIGEPVHWRHEYRCFVADRLVVALSPYIYNGEIIRDRDCLAGVPQSDIDAAHAFAASILQRKDIPCPGAFVLDVGVIDDRGWAVVECNECWASGIYACPPHTVLEALLRGNVDSDTMDDSMWDFAAHYCSARPDYAR